MSSFQLGTNLILTFILASLLLYRYGNWYRHQVLISLAVLVAWYFSFIIIFVLPIDVSTAVYTQCTILHPTTDVNDTTIIPTNTTAASQILSFSSSISTIPPEAINITDHICIPPWSSPGQEVLTNLWRIVYWSSQCLTWLILPIMQSYTKAGEFTIKGKLKSALRDNLIYYTSYLFICGILLVYIILKPNLHLNSWDKIKLVASSASNTWSLFLLTFMLGYGLITIPRTLYKSSLPNYSLNIAYFKVAKLANERNDSEEMLEDALDTFHSATQSINNSQMALLKLLDIIYTQIPTEFRERLKRRRVSPSDNVVFTEGDLIKLNRLMKRALGCYHRAETLWSVGIDKAIYLEEVELLRRTGLGNNFSYRNTSSSNGRAVNIFQHWLAILHWTWICIIQNYCLKLLSILTGLLSITVIWSEATFFNRTPVLSLFAIFVKLAKDDSYNYFLIELIATCTIAYLCICAYYTVFKLRFFNYYYLAAKHQTDEYSLIFCGMLLCRLTPPLCLNFLGLIHLDSHIIGTSAQQGETSYTRVMGHMDVLSIISNGFNIYFPMGILVIGLLTWFRIGARLLSWIGFQQFLSQDDEMTTEMVTQGSDLVKREKRKKQRQEQSTRYQSHGQASGDTASSRLGGPNSGIGIGEEEISRGTNRSNEYGVDSRLSSSNQERKYYSSDASTTGRARYSPPATRTEPPPRDLFDDV